MLTHWKTVKPFADLLSLQNRINRLFGDTTRDIINRDIGDRETWNPATDILETQDEYVFKLDVPGLSKEDVNINFEKGVLTISGEKKENREIKKDDYHRIESFSGKFSRSFTLPQNIDAEKISASIKDGLLELRVGKSEAKKPKSIPISVK
jgi:HSP20 family protein